MSPQNKKKLDSLRKQLDKLDNNLLKIVKKRTNIIKQILSLKEYKKQILGSKLCYGIEAGVINGWEKYINSENFIGMKTFGASAPYKELYKYFGITVDKLVEKIKKNLN